MVFEVLLSTRTRSKNTDNREMIWFKFKAKMVEGDDDNNYVLASVPVIIDQ